MAALLCLGAACSVPSRSCLKADPHYVLGKPYQAKGVWWYPNETFEQDDTGLASVVQDDAPRLTADGEVFDQTVLAIAHPMIQLPAVARLTNLENGLDVAVRVNDRGTGDPRRLVEVTRRTAALLRIPPDGIARVRLRVLPAESRAAVEAMPDAPVLRLSAAPRDAVAVAELTPASGVNHGAAPPGGMVTSASAVRFASQAPPLRMPEAVVQTPPNPGRLMLRFDTFDDYRLAAGQQARMNRFGARIVRLPQPSARRRADRFRVEAGPLPTIAAADQALMQALASGIPDARIVVD